MRLPVLRPNRSGGAAHLDDRISQFLGSAALRLDDEEEPDPLRGYHELLAQLDESTEIVGNENPGCGSTLPSWRLVSWLERWPHSERFLPGRRSTVVSRLWPRRRSGETAAWENDALHRKIDSVDRLREALHRLFREKAEGRNVCVFIDDPDRTMPDVALDLLEALRIFFSEVERVFLVAADENLIGQGLQISLPRSSRKSFPAGRARIS